MAEYVMNSSSVPVRFVDLGLSRYKETWDYQEELFNKVIASKISRPGKKPVEGQHLIFCEHPHVYTLGKSGSEQNLLIDYIQLQTKEAEFFRINRGGDITYHGPGQIVGYPILDLESFGLNPRGYIYLLEESVIQTLGSYGIQAGRLKNAIGVWLDSKKRPGKICAIGVRLSRYVTMHGFAFNVNTNLQYFDFINPCGYIDKGVTSMQKELGREMDLAGVKACLRGKISELFKMNFVL
jgi:lipoyl(octanoyl) transferase